MSDAINYSKPNSIKLYSCHGTVQVYSQTMSLNLGIMQFPFFQGFWDHMVAYLQQLLIFDFIADIQIVQSI